MPFPCVQRWFWAERLELGKAEKGARTFYWQEAVQRGLDESMLVQVSPWQVCFRGTEQQPVRCVNLAGEVGECVSCRIYEQRTTPCRSVEIGDEKCLQARAAHGLGSLA